MLTNIAYISQSCRSIHFSPKSLTGFSAWYYPRLDISIPFSTTHKPDCENLSTIGGSEHTTIPKPAATTTYPCTILATHQDDGSQDPTSSPKFSNQNTNLGRAGLDGARIRETPTHIQKKLDPLCSNRTSVDRPLVRVFFNRISVDGPLVRRFPAESATLRSEDLEPEVIVKKIHCPPTIINEAENGIEKPIPAIQMAASSMKDPHRLPHPASSSQEQLEVGKETSIFHRTRGPRREVKPWREVPLRPSQSSRLDRSGNSLDDLSLTWCVQFAMMVSRECSLQPWQKRSNLIWPRLITPDMDDMTIRQAWSKFPVKRRDTAWQDFMLWALQHSPERALKVLDFTISHGIPTIPRYVVGDCLDYLVAFYLKELKLGDSLKLDRILRMICKFIRDGGLKEGGHLSMIHQRIPYLVSTCCRDDQARYFWDVLVQYNVDLTPWTLLHFLGRFSEMADLSRSMEAIRRVVRNPISRRSWHIQYGCAKLLRTRFDEESGLDLQKRIWTELRQLGIPSSIDMYNAMIQNCVVADDYETALVVYDGARKDRVQPNLSTYYNLLGGLKQGWGMEVLDMVIRDVEADGLLLENDHMICRILCASTRVDFPELLQLYGRYYDLSPLYDFGFIKPEQFDLEHIVTSRAPPSLAVAIMLTVYISQTPNSDVIVALYNQYCALSREGNLHAIAMAETDYVPNAFIQAFGRHTESIELCTTVIEAMLRPTAPSPSADLPTAKVSPPTVISWTLLAQTFCRHGQMVAAEKVISMMIERGVEPNYVTWGVLIFGHAAAQNIDGVMDAVKRMQAAGIPINDLVIRALGMYHDQALLLELLNDAIQAELEPDLDPPFDDLRPREDAERISQEKSYMMSPLHL